MKKFTSLMLMLLCAVTAWAGPTDLPQITTDVNNPIYYTITSMRSESGKLLYYTADGVKDANPQTLTDANKFFFTGSSLSDVKIHNAEAEKSGLLFAGAEAWTEEGVSCEICVSPYNNSSTGLAIKFSGTALNERNTGDGYTTYGANDEGSVFFINLVEDFDFPKVGELYVIEAPIFYNKQEVKKGLVVNEDGSLAWNTVDLTNKNCWWTVDSISENGYAVKNYGTGKYLNGATVSEAVENYAKLNYLGQSQFNIVVNNTTVHANGHGGGANGSGDIVSWGGGAYSASAWSFLSYDDITPFELADSYEDVEQWYYLKFHASQNNYLYYNGADVLDASKTAVDASNKDAYSWAFVGNLFDGFKVVNKLAGSDKQLNAAASGAVVGEADHRFTILASKHGVDGFYMKSTNGDKTDRFNKQGGKVVYWSGADAGSTFTVELRNDDEELLAAIAEATELVASIKGEGVGYATAESVAAINATIEARDIAAIQNAIANIKTIQPAEGAFYYIASAMPSTDGRSGQKMYVNNDGAMQFQNAATLANVFQFVPAGDNTFYLYNVERGTYLSTNKGHAGGQAAATDAEGKVKVAIANMGRANAVSIIPNGGAMLHAQAAGSAVVAWDNTDNAGASAWIISEIADITELSHTLTVGEAGYATLCLGYNAAIPALAGEECGVYTAAVVDGYAAMTKVEGVLPANTAVIVKAAAGTYNFNYATGEASAIENNELKGTTVNKNFTDAAYVLGVVEGEVGLYTAANNVSTDTTNDDPEVTYEAWKNNAFKAYLPKTAGMNAASYSFRFPGTTGIENVVVENGVNVIFDLTGRKVESISAPGIYIVNGKKVLVK